MTDQSIPPNSASRPVRATPRQTTQPVEVPRPTEQRMSFWASLDKPLLVIVGILVAIGMMMVYSTTFDWSYQTRGSATAFFMQEQLRNVTISLVAMIFFAVVDYRFWKRFSVWLLLGTIGALAAVLLFGDDTFGARRSLLNGRFQPSELAEFTIVVYMSAWLGARNTRVNSFIFGLIPFGMLVGIIASLIALQPDLSSAAVIALISGAMFFLAGARITHLLAAGGSAITAAFLFIQTQPYAQVRVADYLEALANPIEANYHTQQAIIAFLNGGWFGVGLGQSQQKFGFLPVSHTDSIFAVIGEELGVIGATLVILLFIAFVIRGFQIARNAVDPFGSLLAIGFTLWVAIQALLNIAVMTALIPSSGLPLPFISYGGSALLVLMVGVGMMLSVSRITVTRRSMSNRRNSGANYDRGWGDRRARLSRTRSRRSTSQARPRRS